MRNALALDGRHAWPLRRGALVRALDALHADVLCLQEVRGRQERHLLRRLDGPWLAFGVPRGRFGSGERCLVLVRPNAFHVRSSSTRWFGPHPDRPGSRLGGASHPRIATTVVLRSRHTGREVGIANTHLDPSDEQRRVESVRQLLGWVGTSRPWVVAGDLNAVPSSPSVGVLLGAGYRDALPADAPGTAHRFTGSTAGPRIDHVLTAPGCDTVRAWVERPRGTLISDHWPVVADLLIGDG